VSRRALTRWISVLLVLTGVVVNLVGASLVWLYLAVVFPPREDTEWLNAGLTAAILGGYLLVVVPIGIWYQWRRTRPVRVWSRTDEEATPQVRKLVLRLPARLSRFTFLGWLAAGLLFAGLAISTASIPFGLEVFSSVMLGGLTTSAANYLACERLIRPQVPLVLSAESRPEAGTLGVGPRIVLTWLLFAVVPLVALALVPTGRGIDDPDDLVVPTLFVVVVFIVAGAFGVTLAARAVSRPIRAVRRAVDKVAAGDLDVVVKVDDASEVGRLQAGFNAMVEGLRERERLRDLFGRQVGEDVAREAMERGVELGGQERTVSALFVDVIGSTEIAHREAPTHVVELLNRFFGTVVRTVEEHGGFVNKFEGDAALCIFGAPVEQPDHAARALAAARALRERLDAQDDELHAAIGVSCGKAVAGNIGTEERFEYTVIGDPVNEAARLTELAKQRPGRLLASAAAVRAAGPPEAGRWREDGEVVLRGRRTPTRLAVPAGAPSASAPAAVTTAEPATA